MLLKVKSEMRAAQPFQQGFAHVAAAQAAHPRERTRAPRLLRATRLLKA
jgi:hypothetical protein